MPTGKRSQYRTDEGLYRCPNCGSETEPVEFNSLYRLKKHMTEAHGGFTTGEIKDSFPPSEPDAAAPDAGEEPGEPGEPHAREPRRLSKKSRELNEKVNEALHLGIEHLLQGLSPENLSRLESLRREIMGAMVGLEFDFDNVKLVRIGGRFGLIALALFLTLVTHTSSIKALIAAARGKAAPAPAEPDGAPADEKETVQ